MCSWIKAQVKHLLKPTKQLINILNVELRFYIWLFTKINDNYAKSASLMPIKICIIAV